MCGRYELSTNAADLAEHFGDIVPGAQWEPLASGPSYNIAPSQQCLVIRNHKEDTVAERITWGFRPHWAKKGWINARAETVFTIPTFKQSALKRRCLVPANGWYEWQGVKPKRVPYHIHNHDKGVFAFAGVWTARKIEEEWEISFAILTMESFGKIRNIHDRMPVVLDPAHYLEWLSADTEEPQTLLASAPTLSSYPVSTYVNDPKNDTPQCAEEIEEKR